MKIIYEAFDGTQFDNEYDCESYEFQKQILEKTGIRVFDRHRRKLPNLNFTGQYYDTDGTEYRVVIHDEDDLRDMKEVQKFTGMYCDIDSIGTWYYSDDSNMWVMFYNGNRRKIL